MTDEDDIDRPVEPEAATEGRFKFCGNPTCGVWIVKSREYCRRCAHKPKTKPAAK